MDVEPPACSNIGIKGHSQSCIQVRKDLVRPDSKEVNDRNNGRLAHNFSSIVGQDIEKEVAKIILKIVEILNVDEVRFVRIEEILVETVVKVNRTGTAHSKIFGNSQRDNLTVYGIEEENLI